MGAPIAALLVAAHLGCGDPGETEDADAGPVGPPAWQVVLGAGALDRAVLSVWGTGPGDVYAVGGPLGNSGFETLAVHFDGAAWRYLEAGGTETYWWVSGTAADDVWMVGEKGRITHWNGAELVEHASGTAATLWGVWAASPTDAWAVGGTPEGTGGEADDVVLRWDGASWSPEALPGAPLGRALFKVWGRSSDDLYVVGEHGTIWHRDPAGWALQSDPPVAQGTLFTVTGCGEDELWAVGGYDVLRSNGGAWEAQQVALTASVNGVACRAPGDAVIVGFGGSKQRLVQGAWVDDFGIEPYADLHAAWSDGEGAFWAVGGNFVTAPSSGAPRDGVVARFGVGTVATSFAP